MGPLDTEVYEGPFAGLPGPAADEAFDAFPPGVGGAVASEVYDGASAGLPGPAASEIHDAMDVGFGSVVSDLYEVLTSSSGPVDDHHAEELRPYGAGPVDDHLVDTVPTFGAGPLFDHFAEYLPDFAAGPVDEHLVTMESADASGALVDYEVVVIPGPFDPLDPSLAAVAETKTVLPLDVRCAGSGGDGSPGVCGRGVE